MCNLMSLCFLYSADYKKKTKCRVKFYKIQSVFDIFITPPFAIICLHHRMFSLIMCNSRRKRLSITLNLRSHFIWQSYCLVGCAVAHG
jgi:hypothetical protein